MAEYSKVASFGGMYIEIGNMTSSERPSTVKTKMGKTFIEKEIPLRNAKDIVLTVNGVITGLSQTSGQIRAVAIENDRAALIALDDGYKHTWNDGKHSGNFVIATGSLVWADEAIRSPGQPYKFTMELIQWQ